MIQFDACIFFKWVGEKPPTRKKFQELKMEVQKTWNDGCFLFLGGRVETLKPEMTAYALWIWYLHFRLLKFLDALRFGIFWWLCMCFVFGLSSWHSAFEWGVVADKPADFNAKSCFTTNTSVCATNNLWCSHLETSHDGIGHRSGLFPWSFFSIEFSAGVGQIFDSSSKLAEGWSPRLLPTCTANF